MAEHRQTECRFSDEDVARHDLETGAGRIGFALVVAGDDHGEVGEAKADLRRSQDMAGGVKTDGGVAELNDVVGPYGLAGTTEVRAVAHGHDRQRFRRGHNEAVTGARMVGMAVGNKGARDRARRIDKKISRRAIKPFGSKRQEFTEVHACR